MKILVTGIAGFIDLILALRLRERGDTVVGVDNQNDYYDQQINNDQLVQHVVRRDYSDLLISQEGCEEIAALAKTHKPKCVVNLIAQVGVRFSIEGFITYVDSIFVGIGNVLDGCRDHQVEHLVYGSSSLVKCNNIYRPFRFATKSTASLTYMQPQDRMISWCKPKTSFIKYLEQ